jgi:hypothetical protein
MRQVDVILCNVVCMQSKHGKPLASYGAFGLPLLALLNSSSSEAPAVLC